MKRPTSRERGFALLTVLWVSVVLTVVGTVAVADVTATLNASRNRIWIERAEWLAAGCVATIQAVADAILLESADDTKRAERWRVLGRAIDARVSAPALDCTISVLADGDRLDVSRASATELVAIFEAAGVGRGRSDLADALLDWMDADDQPRTNGAEADWYRAQSRVAPRNSVIADTAELRFVRGFESLESSAIAHLTGDGGPIAVNSAPRPVLLAVPGFSDELVDRLHERVARTEPLHDLLALPTLVENDAAELVRAHYPEIARLATVDPEAWIVVATARVGAPAAVATVEARLVRGMRGTDITRWRLR